MVGMGKSTSHVRFAAVGDLHVTKDSAGTLRSLFAQAGEAADALLLCGDLTDYGTAEEARVLADELAAARIPVVAVLGNHDYESGTPEVVVDALTHAGVRMLDGEACEIEGVGIAGVKGFAGGFGRGSLGAWGEPGIKMFVQEALNEAMKLEAALAKLRTPRRIALLTIRRWPPRCRASRWRSSRSWAAAGWKSRFCATRSMPSSTATRTAARTRAAPSTACRCSTWPGPCSCAAIRNGRPSCCTKWPARRQRRRKLPRHAGHPGPAAKGSQGACDFA